MHWVGFGNADSLLPYRPQMQHRFLMEYWRDDSWFVGRLKEIPSVFSQGATLEELEDNLRDAYQMLRADDEPAGSAVLVKELAIEVAERSVAN